MSTAKKKKKYGSLVQINIAVVSVVPENFIVLVYTVTVHQVVLLSAKRRSTLISTTKDLFQPIRMSGINFHLYCSRPFLLPVRCGNCLSPEKESWLYHSAHVQASKNAEVATWIGIKTASKTPEDNVNGLFRIRNGLINFSTNQAKESKNKSKENTDIGFVKLAVLKSEDLAVCHKLHQEYT